MNASFILNENSVSWKYKRGCEFKNNSQPHLLMNPNAQTISFGKKLVKGIFLGDMREIHNLTCACCKTKMLRNSKSNELLHKKMFFSCKKVIDLLKNRFNFFDLKMTTDLEKAYNYVKGYAEKNNKLSILELYCKKNFIDGRQELSQDVNSSIDLIREMAKFVSHNSKYMMQKLSEQKPHFKKTDKKIYKELKKLAQIYPDETFFEILNKADIHEKYNNNLEEKQLFIFNEAENIAKNSSLNIQKDIHKLIKIAKKIFNSAGNDVFHKRSLVIQQFEQYFKNKQLYKKTNDAINILSLINKLPNSKSDVNAFMVKHVNRSSNSLMESLVKRNSNTFEHVKPHHRTGDNGASSISNYIALCGKCNAERMRTGYSIFVKSHPEMINNTQSQLDTIIKYINNGILINYDSYPKDIKTALNIESKGIIDVDTSLLDLAKATENRNKRKSSYIEELISANRKSNENLSNNNI